VFDKLKRRVTTEPVLAHPILTDPFELEVDASGFAMGAVCHESAGTPSERTPEQKLWDFKTRAQQYARDRESCDDVRISYLEFLETEAEDDLALARMIAG
jgi:hypothetical protein